MTASFSRILHLGSSGESAWEDLLSAYKLGQGFQPCFLLSPFPNTTQEVKQRFSSLTRVVSLTPDQTLWEQVKSLPENLAQETNPPILWLERANLERKSWRHALSHLNQQREWFVRNTPFLCIMAGTQELLTLVQDTAPDLWSIRSLIRNLPDKPSIPPKPTVIRWLHLGGLHFRATEPWERRPMLRALLRDLPKILQTLSGPLDMLFITGGIAFSGKQAEYDRAREFFKPLAECIQLEPRQRWFLVPDHHDVNDKEIGPADGFILRGLQDQNAVRAVLQDAQTMRLLSRRLEGFYAFTEHLLGAARAFSSDRPWRVDVPECNGVPVAVLQLNSAWAGDPKTNPTEHRIMGELQVRDALELGADAFLRIALFSHPLDELHPWDRKPVQALLGAPDGAAFLLRSHLHPSQPVVIPMGTGTFWDVAVGELHNQAPVKSFHIGEIDLTSGTWGLSSYHFRPQEGGVWLQATSPPTTLAVSSSPFALPPHLHLGHPQEGNDSSPTAELSESRRAGLIARYRQAASAIHGAIRFIGFPANRKRPNARVPELFVPLHFQPDTHRRSDAEGKESVDTAQIVNRLLQNTSASAGNDPARLVVLGDPGSGKTTLCRFLVTVLAGETSLPGVDVPDDILPLLIPFREYIADRQKNPDLSLVDFLLTQARFQLATPLPAQLLQTALDTGRAVLLLDGLDEVRNLEERKTLRDAVWQFCRKYEKLSVLLTSRITGYPDAPMPTTSPHTEASNLPSIQEQGFYTLAVSPFSDEDLQEFVTRWYEIQEPEDPKRRQESTAHLCGAIAASPQVKELARNPLLATLVALIHRVEAHLPGERAKLYELCVRTLLETWPAENHRRFAAIDEGLQRAYLEQLALAMQESRNKEDGAVLIERQQLEATLLDILRQDDCHNQTPPNQHQQAAIGKEPPIGKDACDPSIDDTERLIKEWVNYLQQGTGLLVEQRPGAFGFIHLSFMEYLAACQLERQEGEHLTAYIAQHFFIPHWREVCLLAVGRHTEDGLFLERLLNSLSDNDQRWDFLLLCLREEAVFSPRQRREILDQSARQLLEQSPYRWQKTNQVMDQLLHFSRRHSQATRSWLEHSLRSTDGETLRGAIAITFHINSRQELLPPLYEREDVSQAAGQLLEFWPGSPIGDWAASRVDADAALLWTTCDMPHALTVLRAVAALQADTSPALQGAVADALSHTALVVGARTHELLHSLHDQPRTGGRGVPTLFQLAETFVVSTPHLPCQPTPTPQPQNPFAASELEGYFASELEGYFAREFASDFIRYFASDFASDFARDFARYFASDFIRYFASDFATYFARDLPLVFGSDFASDFAQTWGEMIRGDQLPKGAAMHMPRCDDPETGDALLWGHWKKMSADHHVKEEIKRWAFDIFSSVCLEAWIALATTISLPDEERKIHVNQRVLSRWIFGVWPAIEERLSASPDPGQLALYLALGWTQATVTWSWPGTRRWQEILGGPPPEHWLPRCHWYLCWLTHDPTNTTHREGLIRALTEGQGDPELVPIATSMLRYLPGNVPDPVPPSSAQL